jgi:nucleoside-diphosphate-sugar epimerase
MEKFLITGANGFIGSRLCQALENRSVSFVPCVRRLEKVEQYTVAPFENGSLTGNVDWKPALAGCDVVVHLAARVHVMQEGKSDPWPAYRAANVDATMRLAAQAAEQGVRRFVYVSSIKVNGERTRGQPFSADDVPAPEDAYGKSKLEAERALKAWSEKTGVELVIVRPPLVYGPGVKANFARLMQAVKAGLPLPLGAIHNARSMVGLDNLVDFLLLCAKHPAATNSTWLVSDNQDVSTSELIRLIAKAMHKPARLLPVPASLLTACASLLGRRPAAGRLLDSLQVDISPAINRLSWKPPFTLEAGIERAVAPLFASTGKQRT